MKLHLKCLFLSALLPLHSHADVFSDESKCLGERPAACLRMAFRRMGDSKSETNEFLSQTVKFKLGDQGSIEDKEAPVVAAAVEMGNLLLKKETKSLIPLMEQGCEKLKHPLMCFARGSTLSRPGNTPKERENSKNWASKSFDLSVKACEGGDGFSCYFSYIAGALSGNVAKERIEELLKKACSLKEPQACLSLGQFAFSLADNDKAVSFLKQSCDENYSFGCFEWVKILRKLNKKEDALAAAKTKCDQKLARLCFFAGYILTEDKAPSEKSQAYYLKGCDLGHADSCFNLGINANNSGDTPTARRFFKIACDKNKGDGCFENAKIETTLGNKKEQRKLLEQGCELNSANACLHLGIEESTSKSKKTAKAQLNAAMPFYKKAHKILNEECSEGYNDSCDKLKGLASIATKFGLNLQDP